MTEDRDTVPMSLDDYWRGRSTSQLEVTLSDEREMLRYAERKGTNTMIQTCRLRIDLLERELHKRRTRSTLPSGLGRMTKYRVLPWVMTTHEPADQEGRIDSDGTTPGLEIHPTVMTYIDASIRGQSDADKLAEMREADPQAYAAHDLRRRGYTAAASADKLGRSERTIQRDLQRATIFLGVHATPDLSAMTYSQRADYLLVTEQRAMHVHLLISWQWRIPMIAAHLGISERTVERDHAKIKLLLGPEQGDILRRYSNEIIPEGTGA